LTKIVVGELVSPTTITQRISMIVRRIITLAVVAALVAAVAGAAYAWSQGVRFYAVESGSMSPAIAEGSLVVDAPTTGTTTYQVGEIITFHPTPGYTTTHRIVAIGPDGITTKGDANRSNDVAAISPTSVVGRVIIVVPYGGYVATFFRQPTGVLALLLLIVALYVAWELVRGRKPDAPPAADTKPDAPESGGGEPE
jgi:signal peptidase